MKKYIRDILPELTEYLVKPTESVPLKRFKNFNDFFGGFRANEFSILCGSTGAGKTSLLANLSADLLEQKQKHFVMSVENGHIDFAARVLSVLSNEDLNTGEPVDKMKVARKLMEFEQELMSEYLDLSLFDNRVSLDELLKNLKDAVDNDCKIAFIDNLNFFLEITSAQNQIIEMDRVTHELIMFCKRNPIHIVMVMHPRKTENTRVLSEFDIKGSSTAVQEANNIFLFNRPSKEDLENGIKETYRELKIAKLRRRGKHSGVTVLFDGSNPAYVEKGFY